jgi:hypothetical protein
MNFIQCLWETGLEAFPKSRKSYVMSTVIYAKVATVLGSISASSGHSGIWGAADEAVSNKVQII